MSRTIKRVPLDFDHDGIWPGYQRHCDDDECDGCDECRDEEPPTGIGWQCWETVSEGSPISPVFFDRSSLVDWLVEHEDCSPQAADKFIDSGYAPSMLGTSFGIFKGVQAAAGIPAAIEWQHVKAGDHSTIEPDTRIRHVETGVEGRINHRFPPPNGDYYFVTWDIGLPAILADNPGVDPKAPMDAGCRRDGFVLLSEVKS